MAETKNTKAKDNYVPVFIPFIEGESESQFVSVNDKDYLVRKGETVMVPPEVAEVLENSRIQQASASKRAKALQDKSTEIVQKQLSKTIRQQVEGGVMSPSIFIQKGETQWLSAVRRKAAAAKAASRKEIDYAGKRIIKNSLGGKTAFVL